MDVGDAIAYTNRRRLNIRLVRCRLRRTIREPSEVARIVTVIIDQGDQCSKMRLAEGAYILFLDTVVAASTYAQRDCIGVVLVCTLGGGIYLGVILQ